MATTPTSNEIPSESPRDLKFNAGKIDEIVNSQEEAYSDRFGRARLTWAGIENITRQAIINYGYITVESFEDGATITLPNQVLLYESNGQYYRWDGQLPKVVAAGSTPSSSGGISSGAWISVGDAAIRSDLSSPANGKGDSLIAVQQPFTGAVTRTQHQKNTDILSLYDFGAVGDGVTDDSAAIQRAFSAGVPLRVTQGVYLCSTTLTAPAGKHFSLQGDGAGLCLFVFSSGGIAKEFGNTNNEKCLISNLGIQASSVNSSAAVRLYRTDETQAFEDEITLENIHISGFGGPHASTNTFKYGLRTEYVRFVKVSGCRIWGQEGYNGSAASTTAVAGISFLGRETTPQFGFTVSDCWVTSWSNAIRGDGWIEGVYITGGEYWNCNITIQIIRPAESSTSPLSGTIHISNVHINGAMYAVLIRNCSTVGISNSEMYIGVGGGISGAASALIHTCTGVRIEGNTFSNAYNVSSNGLQLQSCKGVSVNGNSIRNAIDSAVIADSCTALEISGNHVLTDAYVTTNGIFAQNCTGVIGQNWVNTCTKMVTPGGCIYSPATVRYSSSVSLAAGMNVVTVTPSRALSFKPEFVGAILEAAAAGFNIYYDYTSSTTTGIVLRIYAPNAGTFRYSVEYPLN
ncbi:glycosyl hydrolase family 28-related protein [Leclercia sp.]|uniref:tail fiber/spike domain-containing protein n=1 Tax=Leclercia sp. TaxID=1898428 RepID=UPI0028A6DCF1|nr:glycosyl hydrolase family 28-related protein [Leclercia sp.]